MNDAQGAAPATPHAPADGGTARAGGAPRACDAPAHPSFVQALLFWLKLGFISFGGPTGQIAVMHEELVERRRWISESRFLHALNFCMLLPGPEAQQLATYIGWLLHRTWGGIVAGVLFVLPGAALLWLLSYVYVTFGKVGWVESLFYGLKPAVIAVVAMAVWRIGSKALKNEVMGALAALAFIAIYFFKIPFPAIVIGAGVIGLLGARVRPDKFVVLRGHGASKSSGEPTPHPRAVIDDDTALPAYATASIRRALRVILVCGAIWWAPVLIVAAIGGRDHVLVREGVFFSKAAMVTFGGAYAVLPYVAQHAVEREGWLTAAQMLDGLGLAETTPGPLIMVVQWVGFLGGWHGGGGGHADGSLSSGGALSAGGTSPLLMATLGAGITTWTTFAPCFLWILLGAPFVERLRRHAALTAALSAITASVVGVVLNLAVWFAGQVFWPKERGVDGAAIAIAAGAFVALVMKRNLILVILCGGAAGALWRALSA
ncbi:MAG: Chromate transport protein [Phycisphaerae bacterium]|nr:Chromate transport protein [Phycisphaerae bacterium]